MPKTTKSLRLIACTVMLTVTALAGASAASASTSQLSLIQDDRDLFGQTGEDPAVGMSEIRSLGVDIVRTNVIYRQGLQDARGPAEAPRLRDLGPQLAAVRLERRPTGS